MAVHDDSALWDDRPTRVDKLLEVDLASLAAVPADHSKGVLTELAGTDHWIYLSGVQSLVESPAGLALMDTLMTSVWNGELAAVIASTTHEQLHKLRAKAPRFMGFSSALHSSSESAPGQFTFTRSIVLSSPDPADVGWLVAVRYELTNGMRLDADPAGNVDGRVQLVDKLNVVFRDDEHPMGVIVSLVPEAFTVAQEEAAFTTATLAAERLVGRSLGPEERVIAARALFYC